MYSSQFSNNPFITDPSDAENRFPDLSSPQSQNQWVQSYQTPNYRAASFYQQPHILQSSENRSSVYNLGTPQQPTSAPFQHASTVGQLLSTGADGNSYGYSIGNPTQTSYRPAQQQLENNPGYLAQFDPYASIGQGWDGSGKGFLQESNPSSMTTSLSPSTNLHPRECLRKHKVEIESWDDFAWKRLLNSFDTFKEVWGQRAQEIQGRIGQLQTQMQYGAPGYLPQIQHEQARLQVLLRIARSHCDSIAASSFQIREVFEGYRQSGDSASKRRVREASNAAVSGLPDWPPPTF